MNEEERIIELEAALKASEAEVDKWRTGAEIYEAQVGDLQGEYRTQKLSSIAPKVVGGSLPARIGRRDAFIIPN
ncbi:hypothetical protein H7R52_02515 [Weissella confusa]|uniref:Uncharacterized protein n=1 Tax=Weissella confusa TaxID=1583 RepID=A0A923SMP8_WEICO|nr:hypothetical protein [Weissella confusa]